MSACRSCGAEIVWARTEGGKRMPMDMKPVVPKGLFLLIANPTAPAQEPLALSLSKATGPAAPVLYESHFATCPQADEHRR